MKFVRLLLCLAVLTPWGADAQSADARATFRDGVEAFRAENYEQARDLFQRAYDLSERPSILVNLGSAQRQTGQLLEARASYRRFLETSDDARLNRRVQAELDDVLGLIPQLTILVENLGPNDQVHVDGEVLTTIDEPFETNPGWRRVEVLRGERVLTSVRVRVEPEGREEVSLIVPDITDPRDVAEQATGPIEQPIIPEEPSGSNTGLIVGITVGAVAIVAAVVLAILLAGSGDDPYQGNVPPGSVGVR